MEVLEEIAKEVFLKHISQEEGGRAVMEIVYKCKHFFALGSLSQDQLHDFILFTFDKFISVFSAYNPSLGTFTHFLYSMIATSLCTWKRHTARRYTAENALASAKEMDYEEQTYKYALEEKQEIYAESNPTHSVQEIEQFKKTYHPVDYANCRRKTRRPSPCDFNSSQMAELRKNACLVLALKSSYYLDGEMIKKVSCLTDTPENELCTMVEKVNDSLKSKIARRQTCIKCRDNAYFYRKKYLLESERASRNTLLAETINRKLKKHTHIWQNRNSRLEAAAFSVVPSNTTVGRVLGISDRHVNYIINKARKNLDTISLKQYYDKYEDIFGKLKSGQIARNATAIS